MMNQTKIISWNANGLRTRIKNKDIDPILKENPDIILFQETKADTTTISSRVKAKEPEDLPLFARKCLGLLKDSLMKQMMH